MSTLFVNREKEIQGIEDAIRILKDGEMLLRTPIIEFCGVQGIGKSMLLRRIASLCIEEDLFCRTIEAKHFTPEIFTAAKPLLNKVEPVVIIIDALDAADAEQLQEIETILEEFIDNGRLFVVLASRSAQRFENTRSVARNVTISSLEPLKRDDCLRYLDQRIASLSPQEFNDITSPQTRDIIFDWSQGYPLAMNIMIDAILNEHLNPQIPEDQKKLLSIIVDRVVDQEIFARAEPQELERLKAFFDVLAVPRHFNLVAAQEIIDNFVPAKYRLPNSLAYITLPRTINQAANVLRWDMKQGGYCIDSIVRNIFLLKFRIEQPHKINEIHIFLADLNKKFAHAVSGMDCVLYLLEHLYHLAKSGRLAEHPEELTAEIAAFTEREPVEQLLRFYERFWKDQELRETLGEDSKKVIAFIRKRFLVLYKQLPENEERLPYLRTFLSHPQPVLITEDLFLILERGIRHLNEDGDIEVYTQLRDVLLQDKVILTALGSDVGRVQSLLVENLPEKDR